MQCELRTLPFLFIIIILFSGGVLAQSHAMDAQIEGIVFDKNRAVVENALVTVINLDSGYSRTARTRGDGLFRLPLLPLGNYRIEAKAEKFKTFVREGVKLVTGQTVTIDIPLEAGEILETVVVSTDTPMIDSGKTDLSRVIGPAEVKNLPLISRNPYNFALLQTNVNGRPSPGNPFPTINANGYARRVNYLLDGGSNTQSDRAGVRLVLLPETLISEVQLVTNALAPEFGNTVGLVVNMTTPSGTNEFRGSASYRFSRTPFYARPFFYDSPTDLPENNSDGVTAALGGPIIRNRWHFFAGYEWNGRDDNISRRVAIQAAARDSLIDAGLSPSIFPSVISNWNTNDSYIVRSDSSLNDYNRVTIRFIYSDAFSHNFSPAGGLNTLERAADTRSTGHSFSIQFVTALPHVLNEFRFQKAGRMSERTRNAFSGTSPSITISNIASFGAPTDADAINPIERITQVQNNLTWIKRAMTLKVGGGFMHIDDFKQSPVIASYVFPSIAAYRLARTGVDPYSYLSFTESFGDSRIAYRSVYWNIFAHADWRPADRLKVNLGLRYDLYKIPNADSTAPYYASRNFHVDKLNLAPRLGFVYSLSEGGRSTVIRGGAGMYFDTPWLNMYERALLRNGDQKFYDFRFLGNNGGTRVVAPHAPQFPNTFSGSFPIGPALPLQNIDTVAPDIESMYAFHTYLQFEQAITEHLFLSVGYTGSYGRHIPVYREINRRPVDWLADGRPVFDQFSRYDMRFGSIFMAESAGRSNYNALAIELNRRFSQGFQVQLGYTLSRSKDDAPEQNLSTGAIQNLILTDPQNRRLDRGRSFADQRHTLFVSMVLRPHFRVSKRLAYVLNDNQIGIITRANSGETFNIVSAFDLNNDGITGLDRPIGIDRNSGTTPPQFNMDLRYSRFLEFSERYRLERFGDFINVFNINSIIAFNQVSVLTTPRGELIGEIPDFRSRGQSTSQDSRQFQVGIKLYF